MEYATATDLYAQANQQWREAIELDLHGSEDIVYAIMPLLAQSLSLEPDYLPSLDLLSDMLMEIGAYDEALEFAERLHDLAPDETDYDHKLAALVGEENHRRRLIRAYLRQKRQRLIGNQHHH
ncbi:MAG: hypothetical protein WAU60_07515 [Candidatus Competibacter denitrificans]|jgi:tetratricopeptide (TPR) repeat protein